MIKTCVQFLNDIKDHKSASTYRNYSYTIKQFEAFLQSVGGDINTPTRTDVQQYFGTMEAAATTKKNRFACIRAYASYLGRMEIVEGINLPQAPSIRESAPDALSHNEMLDLLRKVEKDGKLRNIAITQTLVKAGLRVSELVALDCKDIVITERTGRIIVRNGKGNKERLVPVSKDVRFWVSKYLESRKDDNEALFLSNYGKRISIRSVQQMLQNYGVRPHQLRHTFATELVTRKNAPITVVKEVLGHNTLEMTLRYTKPTFEDIADWID
ncbi:UNVERIFIED_ORG: integrase/recombinase XerD [Bacillus sp. B2I3]|nr:integrase/recombinase XerD [Bacillus sp. B2I3]